MAASPRYKLYSADGEYQASAKDPALLAACIGVLGEGATIRDGRSSRKLVLWTEGLDGIGFESYDAVCEACLARQDKRWPS